MNDPMFDLGDFSTENGLSKEEDSILLCEYFGGQVTRKQYGLVRHEQVRVQHPAVHLGAAADLHRQAERGLLARHDPDRPL